MCVCVLWWTVLPGCMDITGSTGDIMSEGINSVCVCDGGQSCLAVWTLLGVLVIS